MPRSRLKKPCPRTEKEGEPEAREASNASGSANGGARRTKKGGSRRSQNPTVVAETKTAATEPDPRWAQDLAKLKEMLAAQTTPS